MSTIRFYVAAESGWDFSSRWIREDSVGSYSIENIHSSEIIPVDLNAFMYKFELNIAEIASLLLQLGSDIPATVLKSDIEIFNAAAEERKTAIMELLWDPIGCNWKDFNITSTLLCDKMAFLSSWIPMWAGLTPEGYTSRVVSSLRRSSLVQIAGISTSSLVTAQQWDAPNSWAPLVLLTIEGLLSVNSKEAHDLAVI
jgi:alpha,alpha-trehalase